MRAAAVALAGEDEARTDTCAILLNPCCRAANARQRDLQEVVGEERNILVIAQAQANAVEFGAPVGGVRVDQADVHSGVGCRVWELGVGYRE